MGEFQYIASVAVTPVGDNSVLPILETLHHLYDGVTGTSSSCAQSVKRSSAFDPVRITEKLFKGHPTSNSTSPRSTMRLPRPTMAAALTPSRLGHVLDIYSPSTDSMSGSKMSTNFMMKLVLFALSGLVSSIYYLVGRRGGQVATKLSQHGHRSVRLVKFSTQTRRRLPQLEPPVADGADQDAALGLCSSTTARKSSKKRTQRVRASGGVLWVPSLASFYKLLLISFLISHISATTDPSHFWDFQACSGSFVVDSIDGR